MQVKATALLLPYFQELLRNYQYRSVRQPDSSSSTLPHIHEAASHQKSKIPEERLLQPHHPESLPLFHVPDS